jgi:hypothetical protein
MNQTTLRILVASVLTMPMASAEVVYRQMPEPSSITALAFDIAGVAVLGWLARKKFARN